SENKTIIVWVVKDSKVKKFVKTISSFFPDLYEQFPEFLNLNVKQVLNNISDQIFMDYLLPYGKRSFILPQKNESSFKELFYQFYSFYIKTVPYDFPLRIDFNYLNVNSREFDQLFTLADKLATVISMISHVSSSYSFPSPLIEADARARISEEEFFSIIRLIQQQLPGYVELKDKRRSRSPFNFRL
ncbi:MAG: DNA double-strand break repair nuclease NurA, partial [Candidatus Thorarchaeota archaeon]